jgi:hypothetical protein
MSEKKENRISPEFWLIVAMLFAFISLTLLIIYLTPITVTETSDNTVNILEFRSNLISGIITAFGAWIGAGAAYFFGRENVREAYKGIKELQKPSLQERLREIKVKEIPPIAFAWRPTKIDFFQSLLDKLNEKPDFWFIPIFDQEKLTNVLDEDAILRYYQKRFEKEENGEKSVKDIIKEIGETPINTFIETIESETEKQYYEKCMGNYVSLNLDHSIGYANDQMNVENVKLAIIKDEAGRERYFLTADYLRKYILSL